jgi:hypothetical protein
MAPYNEAARAYQGSGWAPIPVLGKNMPVRGATGYEGTVTAEKIEAWLSTDWIVRARAGRGVDVDNIALRHQSTIAIDIDHGYGGKMGGLYLAELARKNGLPPLPATFSSTAREGRQAPSRQYFYRIPEDVAMKTKPCRDVELCTRFHRFSVVSPSIHPGRNVPYCWYEPGEDGIPPTWGARLDNVIPTLADIEDLPIEWFGFFRGARQANADRSVTTVDLPDLLDTFPEGEPDALIRWLIAKWTDAEHIGHDEMKDGGIHALLLGREGHPGARELYELLVRRHTEYLEGLRGTPDERPLREVDDLIKVTTEIAQQKPITTGPEPVDDDTWQAFLATFTDDPRPRMADKRAAWCRDAMITRSDPDQRFMWHATKAFGEVIAGHYAAERAVDALSAIAPERSDTLRVALAAALQAMEGATR